jgi:hypothetical protein
MVSANQSPTVVTITSPGPQGPQGPIGPPGGATTGSNTFTGNQTITGSILISGSIIPAVGVGETTSSFDLGSTTAAWKDIYVSEGSIKFIKSGSAEITLSAKDGGIQINGGSTISADGVSGQFITSKSLSDNVTVKDSNNSLLMGPIEVETDKEIIVEEGSDLTIFGDIEIQNVATADAALFSTSASYSDSSSYASSASFSDSASYAVTASYALSSSCSCPPAFPHSGSAVISGSLSVYDNGSTIMDVSAGYFNDSGGIRSVLANDRILKDAGGNNSINWDQRSFTNADSQINLELNDTNNIYGFASASVSIIDSTPTGNAHTNAQIAFAQSGSNFFIYVYIGGQWRSASLS